ncbi:MAG: hypothetical protein Q9190_002277 [Brigantiaea leucoxantha]
MLLALLAIVMGSQQLIVLPDERPQDLDEDIETSTATDSKDKFDKLMRESEKQYQRVVIKRLREISHGDRPNNFLVFALQAPLMLLTLSVMAFLAGLCSVVFAPLATRLAWDDDAKVRIDVSVPSKHCANLSVQIAVQFGVLGFLCILTFWTSSFLLHGLFSLQLDRKPKILALVERLQGLAYVEWDKT